MIPSQHFEESIKKTFNMTTHLASSNSTLLDFLGGLLTLPPQIRHSHTQACLA